MTLNDSCTLSYYQPIAALNEEHGVLLVQHTETKRVFVRKTLTVYDADLFRFLKDHPIPHTPRIYEVIEDDNALIVIEEYVDGTSLKDFLALRGTLTEAEAVHITKQICRILGSFEKIIPPIVHRDIKPSNIILSDAMEVTLLDMDAAKWQNSAQPQDTVLLGTHGYAAPEQYGFGASDVRTDIYAVGVLLNVMLTGDFPQIRKVPGYLGEIVANCTELDASRRYASAEQLLRDVSEGPEFDAEGKALPDTRLPGFRGTKGGTKFAAFVGYALLVWCCMNLNSGDSRAMLWANRIDAFCLFMSIILFSGNYMGIWNLLHIDRIRSKWLKILAVVIADFLIAFFWLEILTILDYLL